MAIAVGPNIHVRERKVLFKLQDMYILLSLSFCATTCVQDVTGLLQQALRVYGMSFSVLIMLTGKLSAFST